MYGRSTYQDAVSCPRLAQEASEEELKTVEYSYSSFNFPKRRIFV